MDKIKNHFLISHCSIINPTSFLQLYHPSYTEEYEEDGEEEDDDTDGYFCYGNNNNSFLDENFLFNSSNNKRIKYEDNKHFSSNYSSSSSLYSPMSNNYPLAPGCSYSNNITISDYEDWRSFASNSSISSSINTVVNNDSSSINNSNTNNANYYIESSLSSYFCVNSYETRFCRCFHRRCLRSDGFFPRNFSYDAIEDDDSTDDKTY